MNRSARIPRLSLWYIVLCVCLAVMGFNDIAVADDNPVVNSGFEELDHRGLPVGWGQYIPQQSGQPLGHPAAFKVSSEAYTGQYALLIDVDEALAQMPQRDTIRQAWNQRLRYDADGWADYGEPHILSFRYRTEGDPKFRIGIERRRLPGVGDREIHNVYANFRPVDDWTYAEMEFEWPHPDTHNVEFGILIQLFTEFGTGGKIWIDDIRLSKPVGRVVEVIDREPGFFYVGPSGDDRNEGTFWAPWRTLDHAVRQAIPGDTIVFLPGEYVGTLRPVRSGTPDAPITFKALTRRTVRLLGGPGSEYAIHLSQVEHINIEGFHVAPDPDTGRWPTR